jgi:hypothetical protein
MRFTQQFERYLDQFRLRLKKLALARGVALMSVAALVITLIAVATAIRNGFPDDIVITSRLILAAILGVIVYRFVILPRRHIDNNGAADIEQRTEAFGGRVETYVEMDDERNPMRELIAGPGNYAYGVRHLWFGWAFPGLLPPQSIEVVPGDDGIRLGGSVNVRATMQGFDPARAWVHASFNDGEWQQVEMSDADELFEFTFFSVRQPLEYYVSAANVRSPTFKVHVVDLPVVENLAMTYNFPDWTGRDPETHDPGGDVRAIADTVVELHVRSDRAMTPGELIVDDQVIRRLLHHTPRRRRTAHRVRAARTGLECQQHRGSDHTSIGRRRFRARVTRIAIFGQRQRMAVHRITCRYQRRGTRSRVLPRIAGEERCRRNDESR